MKIINSEVGVSSLLFTYVNTVQVTIFILLLFMFLFARPLICKLVTY